MDLDQLPLQEEITLEMLQVCRDRICALESLVHAGLAAARAPTTPSKPTGRARPPTASKSTCRSKAVPPAQVAKERKSIVKEIKKRITPLKFHQRWDRVAREVKFAADRISPETAEQMLGMSRDSWSSATVQVELGSHFPNEQTIEKALALSQGELVGSVWMKGGAIGGGRFGAVKARRLGSAALSCQSLKLSYTVKSQRLTGSLVCSNDSTVASNKRRPGDVYDDMDSDDDMY